MNATMMPAGTVLDSMMVLPMVSEIINKMEPTNNAMGKNN